MFNPLAASIITWVARVGGKTNYKSGLRTSANYRTGKKRKRPILQNITWIQYTKRSS